MDPKYYNMYPCKRGSETLEVDKWRRGDVMVEQREMQLEVKESQQPPTLEEGTDRCSPGAMGASMVLPDFALLASRTLKVNFCFANFVVIC